ncbi:gamma-glutamyltransferase family protein [Desulfovibrio gilichinskyi]|uniref:Gamma-glutamyltranspeptidase / glutathione hydrolase n=1 Tax=Desulfovibrio gilichinskyi TaxID=1519643 RepID=A0A1X7CQY9_9BACT|nr:gamma-glutamyltransferase family protein [Desulfovibrio gilichinskyi]SMF00820.1 gamma-glutamyltranspeptidase / glutathione hydrolase [Desulfovibrio gilichinskyi]
MIPFEISKHSQPEFIFNSRRSPVYATKGMVASSLPLATEAGLEMLRSGGNAADASIAVAAALAVIEPCSTGLGGDGFALFYNAADNKISSLNGSGKSAREMTLKKIQDMGIHGSLPERHALTVNVPGAFGMWCDLIDRYGTLTLSKIFAPATRYAKEGFPVSPVTASLWKTGEEEILMASPGGINLLLNGKAPRAGEIMHNHALGEVLRQLSLHTPQEAKKMFYTGKIAKKIVKAVRENGGMLSAEDMSAHESLWGESIKTEYRGYEVHECPPNGQGLAALLALNTLENINLADKGNPCSAERLHYQIEAMRLGFADARLHIADPHVYKTPLTTLLSKEYGTKRAHEINPEKANQDAEHGVPLNSSDTVYFNVIDKDGNGCSVVNSIYMNFGTGIVPEDLGFPLQNRGHNFSLDPNHPNVLAPGKRTYHTIIPGICLRKNGSLHSVFGVMGGFMQPQGHMQVISAMLDDGADPQEALNRLRFCIESGDAGGKVCLEEGISDETIKQLSEMGHQVEMKSGYERVLFGRGQIISREEETGTLCAGCDPRSDGVAGGLC